MMRNLLPDARYLFRELIPRAILMTIAFKWLMPLTTLFHFTAGLLAATAFGVLFTGWFSLWGAYIMGAQKVQAFLTRHEKQPWLPLVHIAIMVLVPAAALAAAALLAPGVFALSWLWGLPVGVIALNLVCAATHDYGRKD
jgi:hypothetical protein